MSAQPLMYMWSQWTVVPGYISLKIFPYSFQSTVKLIFFKSCRNKLYNLPHKNLWLACGWQHWCILGCYLAGQRDAFSASGSHVNSCWPWWSQLAPLSANQQHPCLGCWQRPWQVGRTLQKSLLKPCCCCSVFITLPLWRRYFDDLPCTLNDEFQ